MLTQLSLALRRLPQRLKHHDQWLALPPLSRPLRPNWRPRRRRHRAKAGTGHRSWDREARRPRGHQMGSRYVWHLYALPKRLRWSLHNVQSLRVLHAWNFAQYALAPANYVTPIPEKLDSADAAPLLSAGLISYSALRKCGAKSGDWVVVSGAGGGLGHLAVEIGAQGMAYRIIGLDHGSKEALVKDCGAEHFLDITKFSSSEDLVKEIQKLTD
jgi:hypothetical protein